MLDQHLSQLVHDVDGAWGAAIGGYDGLLIESHGSGSVDLGLLVAEHAGLMRAAHGAYENTLGGGNVREFFLRGDALSAFSLPIGPDLFLMVVLGGGAEANLGQARLYGLETARKLKEVL
ncbi:roadblock/LC7 domain-containing protein [Deinococcus pimensis]|uniref:roadblock/LC7 domain-containing protein n=1 Tax=Deinococcus pimensis TaxID=309888 RepID=UPI0004879548|nr:roadblock/LC7 domain-containing protein [Deinococcus pimensis]